MKDEIKTFAEYQSLVREYEESDSLKKRESVEDAVYDTAKELLHKLIALYAKYGRDYVVDSDYRKDRGFLFLSEFDENRVLLKYADHWAYGERDIPIIVRMKYLDNGEMEAMEKELLEKRLWLVKEQLQEKMDATEKLKKEVEELETKLEELERRRRNDQISLP